MSQFPLNPIGPPYLEFLMDTVTQATVDGTVRYRNDQTVVPTTPTQVKIACEPAGTVVLYHLVDGRVSRLASCMYRDGGLIGQVGDGASTTQEHRGLYEKLLNREAEQAIARRITNDPSARAELAAVAYVVPPESAGTKVKNTLLGIIGLVVIAALVVGYTFFWPGTRNHGSLGNGESCIRDTECASGICRGGTCHEQLKYTNGSHCDYSADCASNYCSSRNVCTRP